MSEFEAEGDYWAVDQYIDEIHFQRKEGILVFHACDADEVLELIDLLTRAAEHMGWKDTGEAA
jgi:hypothetical protein